jgi:hypothetical protein
MGQTLATRGYHIKSPADISSASTALCRHALPWARGLQQNIFTLPCPHSDKRGPRQQFTNKTSPMCHYLRGWSYLGHSAYHLRGCPLVHEDALPEICHKTTSAEWTQPPWPSPSEKTIGLGITNQAPSSILSPEKN